MPDIAIPQREIEALILWEKEFLQKLIARLITYILPSVVLLALVFFLLSDYCRPFTPITNISAISNAYPFDLLCYVESYHPEPPDFSRNEQMPTLYTSDYAVVSTATVVQI